jgi:hypothetical protein
MLSFQKTVLLNYKTLALLDNIVMGKAHPTELCFDQSLSGNSNEKVSN